MATSSLALQDRPFSPADTVQLLGSRLGSTFVDGGVHPRFGAQNFTLPLNIGQYIEVVCPLDHPATEQSHWGKAVSKKAQEGGGWLTWVFATEDISKVEEKFGRGAIEGHRTRPDGSVLKWTQIGVNEIATIFVNNQKVESLTFASTWIPQKVMIPIPPSFSSRRDHTIVIMVESLNNPKNFGTNTDDRPLGVGLNWILLSAIDD